MISVVIQNTYHHIEVALFQHDRCIDIVREEKQYASKNFVIVLNTILNRNSVKLSDLTFCTVNQGPSPFTTLRTVIASVNSLHFALEIPLIGIDGLETLYNEYKTQCTDNSLILLNAFNNDVYYLLQLQHRHPYKGYHNIDTLLSNVRTQLPQDHITFLGNGVGMYKEKIEAIFAQPYTHFINPLPDTNSIEYLGVVGYHKWQRKEGISTSVTPLYLKEHAVYAQQRPVNTHSLF